MGKQWMAAAGYLSIFLVPALFLTGSVIDRPWLAFGVVIVVFPMARVVFGALPAAGVPEWRESVATALDHLPVAFAVFLPVAVLWGLAHSADVIALADYLGLAHADAPADGLWFDPEPVGAVV